MNKLQTDAIMAHVLTPAGFQHWQRWQAVRYILRDLGRALIVASIVLGASFACGVLEVLIHRGFQ